MRGIATSTRNWDAIMIVLPKKRVQISKEELLYNIDCLYRKLDHKTMITIIMEHNDTTTTMSMKIIKNFK